MEAYRASVIGNKGDMFEYKKLEVGTFGDKEDDISSKLKEESINKVKESKNYLTNEQLKTLNNYHNTYTFNEDIDNLNKLSIIIEDCNNQDSILIPSSSNNIPESAFTSSIQLKSRNPLVPLTAIENMNISHSVKQLQTKRIRNNKCKSALDYLNSQNKNTEIVLSLPLLRRRKIDNPALKELFDKQGLSWN
ncbi:18504_t:CDS:2 [Dentiscutata erythropus]|uniref:18504_t:CDS:1 n=1 Tax=Dentiscutata erythropus TaxID=1348616 RepID=A0A9N9ELA5_9GLOM|nr:18504_t:CDS:2 [Dentiscutata erythropus]